MMVVASPAAPDEVILMFLESATKALLELDCRKKFEDTCGSRGYLKLSDGRKLLLNQQQSCLHRAVFAYQEQHQQHHNSNQQPQVPVERVQERLAKLKQESNISPSLQNAMIIMDDAARLALCRLMLYSELQLEKKKARSMDSSSFVERALQTTGTLERSKLMEFIALCQTAVRWKQVQHHLQTGEALFGGGGSSSTPDNTDDGETLDTLDQEKNYSQLPSAMKFPQARLEHIQRCMSRAVGMDPQFTTAELKRIFFDKSTSSSNEFSNDKEVLLCFEQLVSQMNVAVTNASLNSPEQLLLSDKDQGGFTRVVSVQFSEVNLGGHPGKYQNNDTNQEEDDTNRGAMLSNNTLSWRNVSTVSTVAPRQEFMQQQDDLTDDEKKRQLRLASEAAKLQQTLLNELIQLPSQERNRQLERARQCSDDFLKQVSTLPPGPERIVFLQSIDPETSRLLALHKLWLTHRHDTDTMNANT
jgi:uncharacterized protein YeaC (DUF1315 family)